MGGGVGGQDGGCGGCSCCCAARLPVSTELGTVLARSRTVRPGHGQVIMVPSTFSRKRSTSLLARSALAILQESALFTLLSDRKVLMKQAQPEAAPFPVCGEGQRDLRGQGGRRRGTNTGNDAAR